MKTLKMLGGALAVVLLALMLTTPAAAATGEGAYTYTVRILAGAQGTIGGEEMVEYTGLSYGDRVTFDIGRVVLEDESKYYVRGIRESGRDNDTVATPSILVTGDVDYVVAYGIPGSTVAYTINYQDADGNTLYPSATYYGNVGDKPVVAFQYIDGYQPQAYNLTKTLSENAADNVFTFVYTAVETGEGGFPPVVVGPDGEPGGTPDANPGGNPGENPGGPGGTPEEPPAVIPEEPTPEGPPPEIADLDDDDVPLAPGDFIPGDSADPSAPSALSLGVKAAIAAGGATLLGLLVWLVFFRKKDKEQKNDE